MLINLRNALMAGKRLPYDAEIEYLESTGTQWIDTGVASKQTLKIRAIFETNSSTSYFAYGVRYDNSTITCATGSKLYGAVRWGVSALTGAVPRGLADVTQDSSGVWESGKFYSYSATQTVVERSGFTITLFAGRNSETTVTANMVGKFYSCKIWDNGVLVRDYIPVRKGNVGYMYDRVSGQLFGNAGTGDFVLGPDVVPVEYIESHGTEYIDTGVVCQNSNVTAFEFKFAYTKYPDTRYVWGSDKGANQGINNLGHYFSGLDDSNVVIPLQTYHTGRSEVHPSSIVKAYIDGTQFRNDTGTAPYTNPFCIFALGGYTRQRIDGLRISSCKVLVDSTLIHNFRPVRVGTDATSWEGAMMDVLTRRIYRNAGTGAFTYGNDLKYPIPAE